MEKRRLLSYSLFALGLLLLAIYGALLFTDYNTGPPRVGNRMILAAIDRIGFGVIGLGFLVLYSLHSDWLVENYTSGMKVEIFTTRRVMAIAAVAAMITAINFIRLPFGPGGVAPDPVVGAYAVVFLGAYEGFFGNLFGSYLYTLIAGSPGGDPLFMVVLGPLTNCAAYAAFAYVYRKLDIPNKKPFDRVKSYILFYLIAMGYFLASYWTSLPGYYGWEQTIPQGVLGTIGGSLMIGLAFVIAIGTLEGMTLTRRKKK